MIGNIILTDTFWLSPEQWILEPKDWPRNTVQGKTYNALDGRGHELFEQVKEVLVAKDPESRVKEIETPHAKSIANLRLGQGAFRLLVTDQYQRTCAITGEKTLPVLEAAHIMPYSQSQLHSVKKWITLACGHAYPL